MSKGPCPLTPTTATLWRPEDILKQCDQENYCNRKMDILWDRRFKMVHTKFWVGLQKRTFVFKKTVVAALYYVLPRWGKHPLRAQRHYKCLAKGEVSGGAVPSSLIQQHNGIMSARFCQNGSDRDSSGIRHDLITNQVSIQELG